MKKVFILAIILFFNLSIKSFESLQSQTNECLNQIVQTITDNLQNQNPVTQHIISNIFKVDSQVFKKINEILKFNSNLSVLFKYSLFGLFTAILPEISTHYTESLMNLHPRRRGNVIFFIFRTFYVLNCYIALFCLKKTLFKSFEQINLDLQAYNLLGVNKNLILEFTVSTYFISYLMGKLINQIIRNILTKFDNKTLEISQGIRIYFCILKLFRKLNIDSEHPDCSICLFNNNEQSVTLPCNHQFHKKCILQWFKVAIMCPNCKRRFSF